MDDTSARCAIESVSRYFSVPGFAAKWHDTLEDKLQSGNIYDNLMLESPGEGFSGKVERVVLTFKERDDNDMSNFRNGDIVILYPYDEGKEPDVRRSMVFRCSIEDISQEEITLVLRAAQSRKEMGDRT